VGFHIALLHDATTTTTTTHMLPVYQVKAKASPFFWQHAFSGSLASRQEKHHWHHSGIILIQAPSFSPTLYTLSSDAGSA
jgi:hypothetical protein